MHTRTQILLLSGIAVLCVAIFQFLPSQRSPGTMEFRIYKTWNGSEIDHPSIVVSLSPSEGKGMRVDIKAPFFNSPPAPNSPAGQPCDRLWDYEGRAAFRPIARNFKESCV